MRTTYALADGIATITLDDGKVNALSVEMLQELGAQLDRAERDEAVVVLTGRASTFSAGFDLRAQDWQTMLAAGAGMAERLLAFPFPTVAACNGNALAMGAFLLLSCDHRVGARGAFKLGLNEVAIGMTLPHFALALTRYRLTRPYADRCAVTGVVFGPDEARAAGFLDELADDAAGTARERAAALTQVDMRAHAATKLRMREQVLTGVRDGRDRILGSGPGSW